MLLKTINYKPSKLLSKDCSLRKSKHTPTRSIGLYKVSHICITYPRQIPKSFSSDILLHNLSYYDIFTLSVWKNLLMLQLPSMLIYKAMKFSANQIVYFLLFNALMKCVVDIVLISK